MTLRERYCFSSEYHTYRLQKNTTTFSVLSRRRWSILRLTSSILSGSSRFSSSVIQVRTSSSSSKSPLKVSGSPLRNNTRAGKLRIFNCFVAKAVSSVVTIVIPASSASSSRDSKSSRILLHLSSSLSHGPPLGSK